jgi:hypothetical protein
MARFVTVKLKGRVRLEKTKKLGRPKKSAACRSGRHKDCYTLNCTCKICGH